MIREQFLLDVDDELIIDNFAGGGGASTGIELALGRHVSIAINHDPEAVAMHEINHPQTQHFCESVWDVNPREVTAGRPIGLVWLSPDCKHFSKAKGGKPREKKIRGLAWVALRWASLPNKPRVLMLENVEEFRTWGPLTEDGQPCKKNKGRTFNSFVNALQRQGFVVEHRELRGMDYGAPTIRKRLFLIARSDGRPIVWPEPTHGAPDSTEVRVGKLKPWPTAGNDVIDWSIPCSSIFERARPLAENTLRRIARGIRRYVLESAKPYIVTMAHGEGQPGKVQRWGSGVRGADLPLPTITAGGGYGVVAPSIVKVNHGGDEYRGQSADSPLQTLTAKHGYGVVAPVLTECANASSPRAWSLAEPVRTQCAEVKGGHFALAAATLIKHYGGNYTGPGVDLAGPMHTATTTDHHALVSAHVTKFRTGSTGSGADEPLHTVTAGPAENPAGAAHAMGIVAANLVRQFGNSDAAAADAPVGTITAGGGGKTQLVASSLVKLRGTCKDGQPTDKPVATISAQGTHIAEVRAFLVKYYSEGGQNQSLHDALHTIPTKDRMGLVTVEGIDYQISDIGMRMLEPHELYRAQGFPKSYVIDPVVNGRRLPKSSQVRMAGNSVCPPVAAALVRANLPEMAVWSKSERRQIARAAA